MDTSNIGVLGTPREQAKRTVELLGDLHRQLKIESARRGVDMKQAVAEAVAAWLHPQASATAAVRGRKKAEIAIPVALVPVVELLVTLFEERSPTPAEEALKTSLLAIATQYQRRAAESESKSPPKTK